jgi:hypothetical protein
MEKKAGIIGRAEKRLGAEFWGHDRVMKSSIALVVVESNRAQPPGRALYVASISELYHAAM